MLVINVKKKVYSYLFWFKHIFINYKYVLFIENKYKHKFIDIFNKNIISLNFYYINNLLNNNYFNFIKGDYFILYNNELIDNNIFKYVSFVIINNYFINIKYISSLNYYYTFYNNNFLYLSCILLYTMKHVMLIKKILKIKLIFFKTILLKWKNKNLY